MRNSKSAMSGKEELLLQLEIEKSKLNREKSLLLLDKSLLMYFAFLIIGVVGFINKYIDAKYLNIMVVLGFGVLAVGLVPYMLTMSREEKKLNSLIAGLEDRATGNNKSLNKSGKSGNRKVRVAKSRS
mgnify:CR=1 FL=1